MTLTNAPITSDARSPRLTPCIGCGVMVPYRTTNQVCCEPCSKARRRETLRKAAERQRRKRGIQQVKGTVIHCERCRCEVVLNRNADARFCRSCYLAKNGEEAKGRSAKKAATPEGRAYANAYQRERARTDPQIAVSRTMTVLMHRALRGGKAGRSWRTLVPYTLEELMTHLERQFTKGMTWENRGKWHIDHIRPLSSFQFTSSDDPGFREAWALNNLRPLWASDNIRKSDKRLFLL